MSISADIPFRLYYSLSELLFLSFTKRYTKIMANKNNGIAMIEKRLALNSAADSGVAKNAEPNNNMNIPSKKIAAAKAAIRFMFFM